MSIEAQPFNHPIPDELRAVTTYTSPQSGGPAQTGGVARPAHPAAGLHTHVHRGVDGPLSFTHAHPWPRSAADTDAARTHRHSNGRHAHPHDHGEYR